MKKSVLFIAIMFLGILAAQEPQSTILYFEEKDFVFFKDEYDKTILYSYAFDNIFYDEDTLKPAIPYMK